HGRTPHRARRQQRRQPPAAAALSPGVPNRLVTLRQFFAAQAFVLFANHSTQIGMKRHPGNGLLLKGFVMPDDDAQALERAREDEREGKSPSTQAGEFVREEIHHVREGKHGARSAKQAIAIGLSKARRAGVKLAPPKPGTVSESTRRQAAR